MKPPLAKTVSPAKHAAAPIPKRSRFLSAGFLASLLFVAGFCFFKAGLFGGWSSPAEATVVESPQPRQLLTRPIADVQPGHRVLADNPLAEDLQHGSTMRWILLLPSSTKVVRLPKGLVMLEISPPLRVSVQRPPLRSCMRERLPELS